MTTMRTFNSSRKTIRDVGGLVARAAGLPAGRSEEAAMLLSRFFHFSGRVVSVSPTPPPACPAEISCNNADAEPRGGRCQSIVCSFDVRSASPLRVA